MSKRNQKSVLPTYDANQAMCLAAIMGCVGSIRGKFRSIFAEAIGGRSRFTGQPNIGEDVTGFFGAGSLHVYGDPADGRCELVFTPTDVVTIDDVLYLMNNCHYTRGQVVGHRVGEGTLYVLFQAVPVATVQQYKAMLSGY